MNHGIIRKQMWVICQNKTIIGVDTLFATNSEWWINTSIIYAKPPAFGVSRKA